MSSSAERKGENEARFREANESLAPEARALRGGDEAALVPFLCECPDVRCTRVLMLSLEEYEAVRAHPHDAICLHGHEDLTIERVVEEHERFLWTRKFGPAADAFEGADPQL
jgi:hypothetical protein